MDVEVVGPELVLVDVAAGDVPAGDENVVSVGLARFFPRLLASRR